MSALNEFVQCSICLENYDVNIRVPKMLICQHSLCSECLKDIFSLNKTVECPICRQNITNSFEEIPKNRYIIQYIESMSQQNVNNPTNNAQQSTSQSQTQHNPQEWNERKYFKDIFDDIDHNHDGEINSNELHEALRKGQPNSEFDSTTVQILLQKYDQNNDDEISFEEFFNLFVGINNQYIEFLDIDVDFSGSIDSNELANALNKKGYNFSRNFFTFIIDELSKRTRKRTITFDMYVRILARMDFLRHHFNTNQQINRTQNFEHFIANNFFHRF